MDPVSTTTTESRKSFARPCSRRHVRVRTRTTRRRAHRSRRAARTRGDAVIARDEGVEPDAEPERPLWYDDALFLRSMVELLRERAPVDLLPHIDAADRIAARLLESASEGVPNSRNQMKALESALETFTSRLQ